MKTKQRLAGLHRRWEAEDRIRGVIPFKDGKHIYKAKQDRRNRYEEWKIVYALLIGLALVIGSAAIQQR